MIDQIFDQIAPRFDRANALASQTEKLKKNCLIQKKHLMRFSNEQSHI